MIDRIRQYEVAEELGVSKSYISAILKGKKSCSEKTMRNLKTAYPDLEFVLYKPHYIVKPKEHKCNYEEFKQLLKKYNIDSLLIDYSKLTKEELEKLIKIILGDKE